MMNDDSKAADARRPLPPLHSSFIIHHSAISSPEFPMLLFPSPSFRKQRGRIKRKPPTPPVVALALVSVEVDFFDGTDGEVRLVFNTTAENPIGDVGAAVATKWTARYGGIAYTGMA